MGLINSNTLNNNLMGLLSGIKRIPKDLKGLLGPEIFQAAQQAMINPQPANPEQWMNTGMELSGMAPIAPVGMFIGKGAKTWDVLKAKQAEGLLAKGVDPKEVWKQTGTMRGVDKALRQEIPDNLVEFLPKEKWPGVQGQVFAEGRSAIDPIQNFMPHQKLADAYPDVNPMAIIDPKKEGFGGAYLSDKDIMQLGHVGGYPSESTTLHEIQHAIQQREGWAKGGSPDMMRQELAGGDLTGLYSPEELNNAYRRLAGEAEARLTQSRMNMTPEERLASYPYDMLDVPQDQLIVRGLLGDNSGPMLSYADEAKKAKEGGLLANNESMTSIYHGTTPKAAKAIEKAGFDIKKSADGTVWFTSNPNIGEVAASGQGAIVKRLLDEKKMKLGGWDEIDKYSVDELISKGYDGVKLEDGGEITYQIFNPEKLNK